MKKVALVLLAFTFLAESQNAKAETFTAITTIDNSNDEYRNTGGQGRNNRGVTRRRGVSFHAGRSDNYYGVNYEVLSLTVKYDRELEFYNTWSGYWMQGWIHTDNIDRPGKRHIKFSSYNVTGSKNQGGFQNFQHNRSRNTPSRTLNSYTKYWLVLDADAKLHSSAWEPTRLKIAVAENRGTTKHGWVLNREIANGRDKDGTDDIEPSQWFYLNGDDDRYPLQFSLEVRRNLPDPFEIGDKITPGNLAEANVSLSGDDRNRGINNWSWVATPFYTASRSGSPPHKFRLDHVTMLNNIRSFQSYNNGEHVIAIYDDRSSSSPVPGREIGRFSSDLPEIIQGNFEGSISSDNNRQHRFHANPNLPILLEPWTRYWLVQKMENWNSGDSAVTSIGMPSFTRSKNADGWSIGDYYFRTHNRGQNWIEVDEDHGAHNDWTMRFGFGATIVDPNQKGDINFDGDIDVFDLILINDHLRGAHHLRGVLFDLGNINSDGGSQYITNSDRDLLLNLILEK